MATSVMTTVCIQKRTNYVVDFDMGICGDNFSCGFGHETFSRADEQDGRVCSEDSERGNHNERGR